jgi:pimeloyl-ACP methyl ester carboxylesterase
MKTRFYNLPGLEGCYVELGYGYHSYDQFDSKINEIRSINIPPHVAVTLYSHDKFKGVNRTLSNHGNKFLKIVNLCEQFNHSVRSISIECACHLEKKTHISYDFKIDANIMERDDLILGYSFYKVVSKDNDIPIAFIIPDFGVNKNLYDNFQKRLALAGISSIILDYRGMGKSQHSEAMQFSEIVQDYRFVGSQLHLFKRKPILIGHGVGGAVAQVWALTYKRELSHLILIDTAPYAVYHTYSLINNFTQMWLESKISTDEYATTVSNETFNVSGKDCHVEKLKSDLKNSIVSADTNSLKMLLTQNPTDNNLALAPKFITVPTLIVHGLQDATVSIGGSAALFALIENSSLRKLKTGHCPQFTTPHILLDTIYNFLSPHKKD